MDGFVGMREWLDDGNCLYIFTAAFFNIHLFVRIALFGLCGVT